MGNSLTRSGHYRRERVQSKVNSMAGHSDSEYLPKVAGQGRGFFNFCKDSFSSSVDQVMRKTPHRIVRARRFPACPWSRFLTLEPFPF